MAAMIRMNESYNKDSNSCMQQLNKNAVIRVSNWTIYISPQSVITIFLEVFPLWDPIASN